MVGRGGYNYLSLTAVADAAQIRVEQWTKRLEQVSFAKVVKFARTAPAMIRSHAQSVAVLNEVLTAVAEPPTILNLYPTRAH